ncbi:Gfo/Idh/MocA family protein [Sphingobacterium daejeonense]|uniref:Gfo/Idh/MocA family protein n=1 Tax=Sphingobacterium daejeonense TaxID=371142 RepID=UPI0010C2EFDB|nr:Gfo/Idh/MocA family oxidoreductase [Sphingobacterium daejeonense]VTQ02480.1 Inositol 2-dehydrogenase [Sphingobacterium daejeonense]
MTISRREFIYKSALFFPALHFSSLFAKTNLQSTLRIGAIGIKGMGWSDLNSILKISNVSCTAISDIDDSVIQDRLKNLKELGQNPKVYKNYKDLLADNEVDAVIIGTPDHWHCLMLVDACKAGKAVYVEKPIGNSIVECNTMLEAKEKYNSIVQVGQWQRSQKHFKDAIDFVHSGQLGKIRLVKAWAYLGWKKRVPKEPDGPVPAGVDYKAWLGPAKTRTFNPNRFHYNFRWYWDYAGGLMTDWGVHLLDYALLGMKVSDPKSIMAAGGKFAYPDDAGDTPDTLTTVYEFDDFNIQWEHATSISGGPYNREHGIAFIGNNGTLVLDRNGWEVIPEMDRMKAVPYQKKVDNGLDLHMENFVEAIRTKNPNILNAPLEVGSHIAKFSQMGNIAYRTGKKIYWEKEKQRFKESEANKLLAAGYHNGYKIPNI